MGRFARLVDTPEVIAAFRAKYRILNNAELQHCELGEWLVINKPPRAVVISMITFIEDGMEIPKSPWVGSLEISLLILGYPQPNALLIFLGPSVVWI